MTTPYTRPIHLARVKVDQLTTTAIKRHRTNAEWLTLGDFHFCIPQQSRESLVFQAQPVSISILSMTACMGDATNLKVAALVGLIVYAGEYWRAGVYQPVNRV